MGNVTNQIEKCTFYNYILNKIKLDDDIKISSRYHPPRETKAKLFQFCIKVLASSLVVKLDENNLRKVSKTSVLMAPQKIY